MKDLSCFIIKSIPYQISLQLQQTLNSLRQDNKICDSVLLLEHPDTISIGFRGEQSDVLLSSQDIKNTGVCIEHSNRGGKSTLHAPGQLVVYFIIDLQEKAKNIKDFVKNILQVSCDSILALGVNAKIKDDLSGIEVEVEREFKKVASAGLSIKRRVTMHGISINLNVPAFKFDWLISCGLTSKAMISLDEVLGGEVDFNVFREVFLQNFLKKFDYSCKFKKYFDAADDVKGFINENWYF